MSKLCEIQSQLKAPKGQWNKFGKYNYRSCEDIVEALKPILKEMGGHLIMSDDVVAVGDRVYVKATVSIHVDSETFSSSAFAREAVNKKGMDDSQITGTASSYARKYALNGLLAIDDTKDADTNEHKKNADNKPIETISKSQAADIMSLAQEVEADIPAMLNHYDISSIEKLPIISLDEVTKILNSKRG